MEKMMSDSIKEIATALSKMQSSLETVDKDRQAYGYKYADLASCLNTLKKPLTDNGLSISQLLTTQQDGKTVLITLLLHTSGEWLKSAFCLEEVALTKQCNTLQKIGAAITYAKRYAISAITGLAGREDDDDAQSLTINHPIRKKEDEIERGNIHVLLNLCKNSAIDAKQFASFHKIKSDEIETVRHAIENFDTLKLSFEGMKNAERAS